MSSQPLFYDDEFHAIRAVIEGGKGYKASASFLWASMKPESAYARLKNCVSGNGDQHLSFGEVVTLMKFNGRFDALAWACDETDHDRPAQRAPADRQAELMREFTHAVEDMKRLATALERAGVPLRVAA